MFVGHMSTLKIIDKHEFLLSCHLKVKKKKINKKTNGWIGVWRRKELKDNFWLSMILLFKSMFIELFHKSF